MKSSKDDDKDRTDQLDAFTEDVEGTHTLDKETENKVETNQLQGTIAKAIERYSASGANTIEGRALTKEQSNSKAK